MQLKKPQLNYLQLFIVFYSIVTYKYMYILND